MDINDQREILHQHRVQQEQTKAAQNVTRTHRMLTDILERAEHGQHILLIVKDRAAVMLFTGFVPMYLSRFITIRCISSHQDINWEHWYAPGWENHMLFVDHVVLAELFPHHAQMFNY